MKKHWLRGVLLGVSLTLLLAGGVAAAASLSMDADQRCIECIPEDVMPPFDVHGLPFELPPEQYLVDIEFEGTDLSGSLCFAWDYEGEPVFPDASPECLMLDGAVRVWGALHLGVGCDHYPFTAMMLSVESPKASFTEPIPEIYGDWAFRMWTEDPPGPSAKVAYAVARDCSVYGFVPEPGSVLLLGSGLLGLAGYGTLRWRTRE